MKSKYSIKALLGGLCVFLLIPPNAIGIPSHFVVAEYLFLFLILFSFDKNIIKKKADFLFASTMLLLYLFLSLHSRDLSIKGFIYTVLLSSMMWAKKNYVKAVFDSFTDIYVYLMLLSCIVYILSFTGIPLPHRYWSLDDATSYTIVDVYANICGVSNLRLCGYFQEPGVVGTISAVLLIANRFKLRPLYLIVLVFSGIASFSLAFFAIIALYAVLSSGSWKVMLGSAIVAGLLYYCFYDLLDELVLYKLSFGDGGSLDFNRTKGDFASWYESFRKTDAYYWGLGGGTAFLYNFGGASYKDIIVDYGLVFFVIYIITFALFAKVTIKTFLAWVAYLLILLVILFQRPFIVLPTYLFLLYAPIIVLSSENKIDKIDNKAVPA